MPRCKPGAVRRPVACVCATFVAACTACGSSGGSPPQPITTTLRLVLYDQDCDGIDHFHGTCSGASLWEDIGYGTPVRVSDAHGELLAKSSLHLGKWLGSSKCLFRAQITVPGGQSAYLIHVDDQGTSTYSQKQMRAGPRLGWSV